MDNKLYKKDKSNIKENIIFAIILIITLILFYVRLPWSIYAPGGVIELNKRLENVSYKSKGSINMTYVSFIKGNIPTLLLALINPSWDIVSNSELTLKGEELKEAEIRDRLALKQSVSDATYLAYNKANIPLNIKDRKIYVSYIYDKSKTELQIGDEILEIDNIKVTSFANLLDYVSALKENKTIKVKIKRNNKEEQVTSTTYVLENEIKLGIAVSEINEYEKGAIYYKDKDKESGSSGGLMLTLAIYDSLIKEDITKGKKICGTGTIDSDGNVGEIAGVKYKILGAIKNKCDIFLSPVENYKEAKKELKDNKSKIKLYSVSNFDEALEKISK